MNARTPPCSTGATLTLMALLTLTSSLAVGATLSVTNYGTDNSSCGSTASPCRSISQAIDNASAGDVIWVGAGHYGNIHGDPGFSASGDERPQTLPGYELVRSCMICVTKPVHIYSYNGAAVTTIDGGSSPMFAAAVMIVADGAIFGSAGHGFTITGGNGIGLVVDLENWSTSVTGVTVSGNVDLRDATGFMVDGPLYNPFRDCPGPQYCPPFRGQILLLGNQAIGSGTGFFVQPITASALGQPLRFYLQDNHALGTGTGFVVYPGLSGQCDECERDNTATDVSTLRNVATGGGVGFALTRAGLVSQNVASYNSQYGFLTVNGGQFTKNSALGNGGPGVIAALEAVTQPGHVPSFGSFAQNNFWGNDRNRPQLSLGGYEDFGAQYNYNPGPSARCGIVDMGAIWQAFNPYGGQHPPPAPPVPAVMLQAPQSYWGSVNGPAPNGAGDAAGGACDQNNASTTSKPFATAALAISLPP